MFIGLRLRVGGYVLFKLLSEPFLTDDAKRTPKLYLKSKNLLSEKKLDMKSKKHAQHVLKMLPLDLGETSFRKSCKKSLKPELRISVKTN